jgi:hypothetical protein
MRTAGGAIGLLAFLPVSGERILHHELPFVERNMIRALYRMLT